MNSHAIIEIAVESIDDALGAARGGADRLELCAALDVGGLTPSLGALARMKKAVALPVMAMIRPRAGGFCYGESEIRVMAADIEAAAECGADGVVFGVLREDGTVDTARCAELLKHCGGRQAVFHRAFDLTPEPLVALEQIIALGFARILTSGQQTAAPSAAGMELIARLVGRAAGRIEILPGGGVRPHNAVALLRATGCTQLHGACRARRPDSSALARREAELGFRAVGDELTRGATDESMVAELRRAVDTLRLPQKN